MTQGSSNSTTSEGTVDFFKKVRTKPTTAPFAAVLYAVTGWGKSSLAACFPNSLFVITPADRGINTLKENYLVPEDLPVLELGSYEELDEFLDQVIDADEVPWKYLVFDQWSAFEALVSEWVCDEFCDGYMGSTGEGFNAFGKGPKIVGTEMNKILNTLERIRDRGVGIIIIAHSVVKGINDPTHGSYDKHKIDALGGTEAALNKWADTILYGDYVTRVEEGKGFQKNKAYGGSVRQLNFTKTSSFEAKNRYGLKDSITGETPQELFDNFKAAMKQAKINNKKGLK